MKLKALVVTGIALSGSVVGLIAESTEEQPKKVEAQKEADSVVVVTAKEAQELLAKKEGAPVVIDIRTAEEFNGGHIEGAKQIDFKDKSFREELAKLDPKKSYLFHCRSGGRSTMSLPVWKELGFRRLYHLDSGILGWEKAKGELVKGE